MAIDVEWQDERGASLRRYEGPLIDGRLLDRASDGSACLRFVDPYGDTTFNAAQVPVLEDELARLARAGDEVAHQAKSLLTFLRQCPDRTHRYLKFIGD
jgi:hypothetical protein